MKSWSVKKLHDTGFFRRVFLALSDPRDSHATGKESFTSISTLSRDTGPEPAPRRGQIHQAEFLGDRRRFSAVPSVKMTGVCRGAWHYKVLRPAYRLPCVIQYSHCCIIHVSPGLWPPGLNSWSSVHVLVILNTLIINKCNLPLNRALNNQCAHGRCVNSGLV